MKRTSTICSIVAGLAMLSACNKEPSVEKGDLSSASTKLEETVKGDKSYTLRVGEMFILPYNTANTPGFIYGGMPNKDENYSLIVYGGGGDSRVAYPLYFSIDQRQICINQGLITVLQVTPEKIELTFKKTE